MDPVARRAALPRVQERHAAFAPNRRERQRRDRLGRRRLRLSLSMPLPPRRAHARLAVALRCAVRRPKCPWRASCRPAARLARERVSLPAAGVGAKSSDRVSAQGPSGASAGSSSAGGASVLAASLTTEGRRTRRDEKGSPRLLSLSSPLLSFPCPPCPGGDPFGAGRGGQGAGWIADASRWATRLGALRDGVLGRPTRSGAGVPRAVWRRARPSASTPRAPSHARRAGPCVA